MKKILIALFLSTSSLFAHLEHIHQHIVYEAYQLLKVYHGINIPAFENNMGSFGSASYFWTTGQILKGAYLEDHHDPATNAGGWFNGWTPSSTHFWDGDCGDGCMTPIYASDPVINAYQKALIYLNGSPTIQYARSGSRYIKVYKYISLKDLLVNGNLHQIGYYTLPTMDYTSCNVWHIATNEQRRLFVWEIVGRICHLLADMSIPAHVRNELHPNGNRYELEVAGIQVLPNPQYQPPPYTLYNASTAYNSGGFINPYTNATDGNPI